MKKSLLALSLLTLLVACTTSNSSETSSLHSEENSSVVNENSSSESLQESQSSESKVEVITSYSLTGSVKNVFDGKLEGVKIYANDTEVATTSSDGSFTLSNIASPTGSYVLRFEKEGYDSLTKDVTNLFTNQSSTLTLEDVDLAKTYSKLGSLVSKPKWQSYEAFTGYVSRNSKGVLVRLTSDNTIFTSQDRNSQAEVYFSVGEVTSSKDANITQVNVLSNKSFNVSNCGGKDVSKSEVNVNVNDTNGKTIIDIEISYASLGMSNDQIIGIAFGLWSNIEEDWAPMSAIETTTETNTENPTTYVRCDKTNSCFISNVNDYPPEITYDKNELIKDRPYNICNPSLVNMPNADDIYLKVIKGESSFTFDMIGFGTFADSEYLKLVLHTSSVNNGGWKLNESDITFLISSKKAAKKTGLTDFWGYTNFTSDETSANHAPIYTVHEETYFSLSFEVDFNEIPEYASDKEVSFMMIEFGNGVIYNNDPWVNAMMVNGAPCGDPASQVSYQVIQEKEYAFDKDALLASYDIKFSNNIYAKFERKDYSLTLNLLSFSGISDTDFIRFIIDTDATPVSTLWGLDASDVSIILYKNATYLETGVTDFWANQNKNFHGQNTTLNSSVYEENPNGYWTLTLDIDYSELGFNINKESALNGLLLLFNPEIQNNGFSYYGNTNVGDQAYQTNYFTI